ncbi:uncharacterized protein [Pocillopora verrucosa]|uniref:uncharacterized protein isoform X1 n=1 Tax=Pocillopora verrucosa TaxID=203993 RepID=UPI0033424F26
MVKSLSKQDVGKSRTKSKDLWSSEDDDIAWKQKPKENQKKKKKGKNIIDSDSDEDPLPPKIRKATSVKKEESSKARKSRRAISLDSACQRKQSLHPLDPNHHQTTVPLDIMVL